MRFIFKRNNTLPQLAWCAQIRPAEALVEVEHGSAVETREDFFFEGAWNGGFSAEEYLAASVVAGTGGAASGNRVHFIPSSDRVAPLFSLEGKGGLMVSNSPIFALAASGERLDEMYPFYFYDFLHFWRMGLQSPFGSLRLASGKQLRVHFFRHLVVGDDGKIFYQPHSPGAKPEDYHSYYSILMEGVEKLFSNARDESRPRPLLPWAAISRGYDSTATACLAARAGCREAFSFIDSSVDRPDRDSGKSNAALLGMQCQEYDRFAYREMPGMLDAEFSMLGVAALSPLAALGEKLQGTLLITGYYADLIWSPLESGFCDDLTIPWARFLSGLGHLEFRLRAGFQMVAPACISCRHIREVHRIMHSSEMKPWWIENSYNRPIPRRIAEEAGIPRGEFGIAKYANAHSTYGMKEGFSSDRSHQDYFDYVEECRAACERFRYSYWMARYKIRRALWSRLASNDRIYEKFRWWRRYEPYLFYTKPYELGWHYSFTFQWSEKVLRGRYLGKSAE